MRLKLLLIAAALLVISGGVWLAAQNAGGAKPTDAPLTSFDYSCRGTSTDRFYSYEVIKSGNENFTTIKNGVRYMSVADSRNEKTIKNSVEKTRYLSFNIAKDGGVTYIFKKLFE